MLYRKLNDISSKSLTRIRLEVVHNVDRGRPNTILFSVFYTFFYSNLRTDYCRDKIYPIYA